VVVSDRIGIKSPEVLQAEFWRFHQDNPHVFGLFTKYAIMIRSIGLRRYSADALLHRVRWDLDVATAAGDGFKINNNHAAFYARLLVRERPEFVDFFETRKEISLRPVGREGPKKYLRSGEFTSEQAFPPAVKHRPGLDSAAAASATSAAPAQAVLFHVARSAPTREDFERTGKATR